MEGQSSETRFKVAIRPLNRFNWEEAVNLKLHDYQADMLPSNLHTIALSRFERMELFGIFVEEVMVGFMSFGDFSGVCWINRIMIDKEHQEQGIGREALIQLLDRLRKHPHCSEIRTSFARQNAIAEYFFGSVGFIRLNDGMSDEIVMVFKG